MKPSVNIIVAIDRRGAIGIGGDLVYRFKEDLRHFKTATMGSTVVMVAVRGRACQVRFQAVATLW